MGDDIRVDREWLDERRAEIERLEADRDRAEDVCKAVGNWRDESNPATKHELLVRVLLAHDDYLTVNRG